MAEAEFRSSRDFLKDNLRQRIDFSRTDQSQGVVPPPIEKPFPTDAECIDLSPVASFNQLPATDVLAAIKHRRSRRAFSKTPLSLPQLSFLLWATQGIQRRMDSGHALRTVPSAGARHALETYLCVINVSGLDTGIYRYLPLEHQLLVVRRDDGIDQSIAAATLHQNWMANAGAVFIWATIPYRMEWRYALAAHRVILLDAGHVCQNLYLACEAISAATCAVAAFDQELTDRLLGVDGEDEFAIYMAAVGGRRR